MPFELPRPIKQQLNQLEEIVTEYPFDIPVMVAADFLHTDPVNLREYIESGHCPFAFCWQKNKAGYRAFKIPSTTFFLWYTAGMVS